MRTEIILNSFNTYVVLESIAKTFKAKVVDEVGEKRIEIPKSVGEGFIIAHDFKDGLCSLLFKCRFKKDVVLRYVIDDYQPLRLIFCMEGDFTHLIKADRIQYQLDYLLGAMVSGTCKNEQTFILPSDKQIHYYSIEIDRKEFIGRIKFALKDLPNELKEIFYDTECANAFLYQSHYGLTISECIKKITESPLQGLVRRIFFESKTLEILALQVKQYLDDLEPTKKQSLLRKKDIDKIVEAHKILTDNLDDPPTLKKLATLTGTNTTKLKHGFKSLYNSTYNNVLQDERLNQAKILLAEKDNTIKEIARKLGYKHAGHFTSKFKEKYGVLPKDYLKTLKV